MKTLTSKQPNATRSNEMKTVTLRNPMDAKNLDDLCNILNDWAETIAYRESPDDEPLDYHCRLDSLPVFSENPLDDTTDVYSWDDSRALIVGEQITPEQTGWMIVGREVPA